MIGIYLEHRNTITLIHERQGKEMTLILKEHATKFDVETRVRDLYELGKYTVKVVRAYDGTKLLWRAIHVSTSEEYMPNIEYDDGYFNKGVEEFKIQTDAYGAKSVDEIEKIIEGYKEAVEAVKILTERFF